MHPPIPIIVDTREQQPWAWPAELATVERKMLASGDYSLSGQESTIAIERKSLADLVQTLVQHRERFERELERLAKMSRTVVIIEGELREVLSGHYRSRVPPMFILSLIARYHVTYSVPIVMAGNRALAQVYALRWLSAVQRWSIAKEPGESHGLSQ